jgi:hypothetical protein
MIYSDNLYINKLVYDLKLHDAKIINIKLLNDEFEFIVSCSGMKINYYFNELENIDFKIKVKKIEKLIFDFSGSLEINYFTILKQNEKYILKTDYENDFYIECLEFEIIPSLYKIKEIGEKNKKLDEFLKKDI